jgi:hypothetical protein
MEDSYSQNSFGNNKINLLDDENNENQSELSESY